MPGHDEETKILPTESRLMDSLNPEHPPVMIAPEQRPPRIWKFWGTALWGLFVFAAMFIGQIAVVAYFLLRREGPIDMAAAIHVVGGGCQNTLLCQLTADACNRVVLAGPVEATAIGNVLVQAMGLGLLRSLPEAREVVRRSFELQRYEPRIPERWDEPYFRFMAACGQTASS